MPMAPPKACIGPAGQHDPPNGVVTDGGFLCRSCKAKSVARASEYAEQRRSRYPYHFEKFRAYLQSCGNMLCQFVDPDRRRRCERVGVMCHHLLDAAAFPQFLTQRINVVFLCRTHHPNTPGDPGVNAYVPTQGSLAGGEAVPFFAPFEPIPAGAELWTLDTQRRLLLGL
jgi:hypothetical protein